MLKYKDYLKLNHKQRRKIWKKEKRRRKRILDFLSRATLNDLEPSESEESPEEEENSNLPIGPLTNFAIICHLKKLEADFVSSTGLKGILQNANENSKTQVGSINIDSAVVDGTSEHDGSNVSNVVSSSNAVKPLPQQSSPIETAINNSDNENEEDLNIVPHTENENNEISDLLSLLDDEVERWHNPMAPVEIEAPPSESVEVVSSSIIEDTAKHEDNRPICNFFAKVGICRFGDKCSRKHCDSESSDTLLFFNMFQTAGFNVDERNRFSRDVIDDALEHTEQELYDDFLDFHEDIFPEFEQVGKVLNLFVCSNLVKHLCGNVYVQYENVNTAKNCYDKMFGRFYNGKQIFCKFVAIKSWNEAICGIHLRRGTCQRGGQCNFLHIFRNKNKSFYNNSHRDNNHHWHHGRNYDSTYRRSRSRHDYRHYDRSRSRSYYSSSDSEGNQQRKQSKKHKKSEKKKLKKSLKKNSKACDQNGERKSISRRKHSDCSEENDSANFNERKNSLTNSDLHSSPALSEKDSKLCDSTQTKHKKSKKKKSHKKKKS